MAQTDLYPILRAYANKNNSPYIDIDVFLEFLEKYSKRKAEEQPEWAKWTRDTGIKFWSEMSALVEGGKCALMADTPEGRIYMPFYYVDTLQEAYRSIDDSADSPFPGEESLRITLPEDQTRLVNVETDMEDFFNNTGAPLLPVVKLIFPDGYGSALALAPMIPRRIMEAALLKVRHYLRSHANKEYAFQKLSPQLAGKEKYLKEMLDQILIRPIDCLSGMEAYSDFTWLFWAYFCSLVRNDIKKKKEILTEDLAAVQAVYIVETCNRIFKARAIKKREQELAFRDLELHLEKPPFYYSLEQILRFTNNKGVALLGQYSREALDEYIKKRTTETKDKLLPEWFIIQGKNEGWYIKKEKFLPLCSRLLIDARPHIKKAVTSRWVRLIKTFRTEAAMEKDAEFDKLLSVFTMKINPVLTALLNDEKLLWVYEETEQSQEGVPAASRIFSQRKLLPMSALYVLRRKELITDARILLPFWYSVPVLSAIIAFFKNLGKKRKQKDDDELEAEKTEEQEPSQDIQNAAKKVEAELVPGGQTLDSYLAELETRWIRLLNKQARADLVQDVNTLVRDHLRHFIRIHKHKKISREGLGELTVTIIDHTPALQSLGGQESLRLYMELYMVKLLLNIKM